MLPKKFRLTYKEYIQNKERAKRFVSIHLDLFIKPTNNPTPKILVLTPKIIEKRSVYRHKTKRVINEAIKEIISKIKNNNLIMIKAKKTINKKDRAIVKKEIESLLFKKQ